MDYSKQIFSATRDEIRYNEGLRSYMLSVYNYMTLGLSITGFMAYLISSSPMLLNLIYGTPLQWVVTFAPLAMIFLIQRRKHK